MNAYEAKQQARRDRLEARADRLAQDGNRRIAQAKKMADLIPFGQPILVGHHSEKSDRAYRGRIRGNFDKGFQALKAAGEVKARAESVGSGGISSDDPDAVTKLREELAPLEAKQARMVAANKLVRKGDRDGLAKLGFGAAAIDALFTPDCFGLVGFAGFQLSNNSANVRRIKLRIAQLERLAVKREAAADKPPVEVLHNSGARIVENIEANRLQIFFPGKPSGAIRAELKGAGFRWAPSEGAWQRHLGTNARWAAERIVEKLVSEGGEPCPS